MTNPELSADEYRALKAARAMPSGRGEDFSVPCSVDSDDTLTAFRAGEKETPLARVQVETTFGEEEATLFITAKDARRFAAHLLNAADEIDGTTPLVFFPRLPEERSS